MTDKRCCSSLYSLKILWIDTHWAILGLSCVKLRAKCVKFFTNKIILAIVWSFYTCLFLNIMCVKHKCLLTFRLSQKDPSLLIIIMIVIFINFWLFSFKFLKYLLKFISLYYLSNGHNVLYIQPKSFILQLEFAIKCEFTIT